MLGCFSSSCRRIIGRTSDEANPLVSSCEVEKCRKLGILHIKHGNKTHCRCVAHKSKIQITKRKTLQCSTCKEVVVDIHIIDLRDASIVEDEEHSLSIINPATPVSSLTRGPARYLSFGYGSGNSSLQEYESENSSFQESTSGSYFQKGMIGAAVAAYGVGCYFLGVYINNC